MDNEERLNSILARHGEAVEQHNLSNQAAQAKKDRQSAERARLLDLWNQRIAALKATISNLNGKLSDQNIQLALTGNASEQGAAILAKARVTHLKPVAASNNRFSLTITLYPNGNVGGTIGDSMRSRKSLPPFSVESPEPDKWLELVLEFLDLTLGGADE